MSNPMQERMMQMMNNPKFQQQFMKKLRSMNPSQVLAQIENNPQAMNIPMVKNIMEMRKNNDTEGLTGLAENVFSEKGQNYSDFEKQAKQYLGFN